MHTIVGQHIEISIYPDSRALAADPDSPPDPLEILRTLRRLTPDDAIVATDVGQHQMWTAQHFEFRRPRTLLTSGGLGTMGYGLGAAIGAQAAFPNRRVVLISGDGSFHMNLNELTTLASYEFPIVVVVMNNRVLGMVRQWQKVFYGRRFSATDPHRKTDLVKLAEASVTVSMAADTMAGDETGHAPSLQLRNILSLLLLRLLAK